MRKLLVTVPLAVTGAAHAAAIDVSTVVSEISANALPIGLVSAAVLMLMVGIKAVRWVRSVISLPNG